jgi:integrase
LCRRDWNPLRSQLNVGRVVVVEVNGKNVVRDGGKTDAAARLLSVPPAVAARLDEHIDRYEVAPGGFLFTTEAGALPLRTNFSRRVFAPAVKAAGLGGRRITVRQLRHTGASLMLDAGLALQDVSQRMGHARPFTTFDIYSHLLTARQEAGTAALDAAIRQATGS